MENKDDKLKKEGQYIVQQALQKKEKKKKINKKNQEFKVTDEIIEAARLIKEASGFFKDYPADPDFILVSKKFPLTRFTMAETVFILGTFFNAKE